MESHKQIRLWYKLKGKAAGSGSHFTPSELNLPVWLFKSMF